MIQVDFGPYKDTFGYNNFQSFIDHVDHYQYSQQLQYSTDTIKFQFNNSGIPIFDIFEIETSAKHNLNFKNVNVIVVETFRQFLSILNKLDKSKKYIILSESYWDTNGYQIDLNYELIFVPWDLIDCQNRLTNRSNLYFYLYDLDFFTKYDPKYDFLCLVGRTKQWRDQFVNKLQQKINLDNSLISYYGNCIGNKALLDIDFAYERSNSRFEFENKFYKQILIPGTEYKYNLSHFTKNELFYNTKFSVIVETEAELEEYHITEKTIKCLILGHPFVVIGTPKYLNFLHSLGFTTYSDMFDESYDNLTNLEDRMNSVINLIEKLKLQDLDIKQLKSIQEKNLKAIVKIRHKQTYEKFLGLFNV